MSFNGMEQQVPRVSLRTRYLLDFAFKKIYVYRNSLTFLGNLILQGTLNLKLNLFELSFFFLFMYVIIIIT